VVPYQKKRVLVAGVSNIWQVRLPILKSMDRSPGFLCVFQRQCVCMNDSGAACRWTLRLRGARRASLATGRCFLPLVSSPSPPTAATHSKTLPTPMLRTPPHVPNTPPPTFWPRSRDNSG
jgi:hypothetical protein